METVFKVGDRVYCIIRGWGIVSNISCTGVNGYDYPITVEFQNDWLEHGTYTLDGRYFPESKPTLSFTEYTIQGFSQERPINLPEVGELCLVRDGDDEVWKAVEFNGYDPDNKFPYFSKRGIGYKQLKRIKILD